MGQVRDGDSAVTYFSEALRGFIVALPNDEIHPIAQFKATFKDQLLTCLEKKSLAVRSTPGDEWTDVGAAAQEERRPIVNEPVSAAPNVEFLPDPESLPRPSTLLLKPPYHLFIYGMGDKMQIQCSHTPTLDFLSTYLKKWSKVNPNLINKVITCHDYAFVPRPCSPFNSPLR